MIKNKKNYQKPTKIDAHFKYKCINKDCGYDHWLSFNEAATKNFKIVCECGTVFFPKPILKIKIIYKKPKKSNLDQKSTETNIINPSFKIIDDCSNALVQYGFTQDEAKKMIILSYQKIGNPNIKPLDLIKETLKNLETTV